MTEDDPLYDDDVAHFAGDEDGGDGDADPWSDRIGTDDELDQLWSRLLAALGDAPPADLAPRIAAHFATLGARSRRTTEGLILALTAATAAETGGAWEDWRVILHRHFVRDERMDVQVAAAILAEWQKESIPPDWHRDPDGVTGRVLRSYGRDIEAALAALETAEEAAEAASDLAQYASEVFDFASALSPEAQQALRDSPEAGKLLADLRARIAAAEPAQPRPIAAALARAAGLLEVTARALELQGPVVH
ncbi:hypothetical protein [Acidisoma sp. C75]